MTTEPPVLDGNGRRLRLGEAVVGDGRIVRHRFADEGDYGALEILWPDDQREMFPLRQAGPHDDRLICDDVEVPPPVPGDVLLAKAPRNSRDEPMADGDGWHQWGCPECGSVWKLPTAEAPFCVGHGSNYCYAHWAKGGGADWVRCVPIVVTVANSSG